MAKTDIAEMVVEQIEKHLESGNLNWDNGRVNTFRPYNPVSRSAYRGINVFNLGFRSMVEGWEVPHFMTFNQVKKLGANVIKGSKSEVVVFWKFNSFKDKKNPDKTVSVPLLRYYRVFNIAQIENLPEKYTNIEVGDAELLAEPEALVDAYLGAQNLDIIPTFSAPYYSPSRDVIGMPKLEEFKSSERYYESLFHEMIHSTGHKKRLARFTDASYPGAGEYAREELVAEFGAAFLMAQTGAADSFKNMAAYLKSWWKVIKQNPKDLVVAAGRAQKASEFISGIADEQSDDKEDAA